MNIFSIWTNNISNNGGRQLVPIPRCYKNQQGES